MKAPGHFLRPSLLRRVVWTVFASFVLVWLVLVVWKYVELKFETDKDLSKTSQHIGKLLMPLSDRTYLASETKAISDIINEAYRQSDVPDPYLVMLYAPDGTRLFRSHSNGELVPRARDNVIETVRIGELDYHILQTRGPHWILILASPSFRAQWVFIQTSKDIWTRVLLAFAIILLALSVAVWGGLRPLQKLSRLIAARHPDDLAPLAFNARHAELVPLVEALDRLLAALKLKIERERAFVQDAAHELRTPIAVISAEAHVLSNPGACDATEAGARMNHAVARTTALIDKLLEMARLDDQRPVLAQRCDLAAIVREEIAGALPRAIAKQQEVSFDGPEQLPLDIEPAAFHSIIQNLLHNALAYVQDGGRIEVRLGVRHQKVDLTVWDDGPGIAPADRVQVFERFHRGSGHASPGSGLGLAIVRQAAHRLRGTVALSDGLDGRGCCFRVRFPLPAPLAPICKS
ncbi:HAMP domain-containing sensor histidine kinase [Paludibacterium sp.]|uniref:sensor histidine kinase n=1 Tax=Paludibacterium sp. TaxID=1917523 RepID=UPI0025ED0160|nr:HAMP domain-containing sensor histidine kinase [Paludibacterium sp.]MBV8648784.1 HAMP domain-containing histidine kinase [Paludibacterium sp.]